MALSFRRISLIHRQWFISFGAIIKFCGSPILLYVVWYWCAKVSAKGRIYETLSNRFAILLLPPWIPSINSPSLFHPSPPFIDCVVGMCHNLSGMDSELLFFVVLLLVTTLTPLRSILLGLTAVEDYSLPEESQMSASSNLDCSSTSP